MSWFESAVGRIYYEEEGSGEPLLLMPGWGESIAELTRVREALTDTYRVIAADVPGSGKSEPQPRQYVSTYYRDDSEAFLAMLDSIDATPAHLVGFSDGGEYALLMAAMRPSAARSVVTWGALGKLDVPPEMLDVVYNLVDAPIPPLKEWSDDLKGMYGESNARVMAQTWSKALRGIVESGGDISWSKVGAITCPALLITGENDSAFAPPALVSQLAGMIPGGEFVEAKGAGHLVHRESPEFLIQTITEWLAKKR